jgi:uncharacterized protein (DUF2252 family)
MRAAQYTGAAARVSSFAGMILVDPVALAQRQLVLDRARTGRFPALLERKVARMTASPLALLRGAAPLFYELLAAHPSLAQGPRGKGWIAGDLHLENFGAYRAEPAHARGADASAGADAARRGKKPDEGDVVFDLNDFDDAVVGPWRVDLLRLVTSLILGGRELGADGRRVLDLAHALLDAYVAAAFDGDGRKTMPREPDVVARLRMQVAERTRAQLLGARTEVHHGERRFVRGERYADLPHRIAKRVPRAFEEYARHLGDEVRPDGESLEVLDAAWRIAGTGSLGGVRVAILVRGKGGADGAWVFDMKEEGEPSATHLLGKPPKRARLAPAERVREAAIACVARPPRLLGTATLDGISMIVRRLAPQEDKLDLVTLRDADLDPLAAYLGALVGRAHARGATKRPHTAWTEGERAELVDRAIAVAGIHEALYLALCKLTRGARTARTARKKARG